MTFLIDIGRVLLDFNFERSLARLIPPPPGGSTLDMTARMAALLAKKDEFEAGRMPMDDYIDWALGMLGSSATPADFKHAWCDIFTLNQPMWDTVERLRAADHRLILFSNTNELHWPWLLEQHPALSKFDGAVLSFEIGAVKPEPAFYTRAIAEFSLIPSETGYLDDLPENIAAGREHGFHCWQYDLTNHAAMETWLADLIAKPNPLSPS